MNNKSLIFFLCFVFIIVLVSSQPPTTTVYTFPEGYTIVEIDYQTLEVGKDFNYFFYLYNTSSGLKIDNTTVVCNFHMTDAQGNLLIEEAEVYQPNGYWYTKINGSYINQTGYYYYGVDCSDGLGGAVSGVFDVTFNGNTPVIGIDILLLVFFCFLFIGTVYLNRTVNYDKWYSSMINKYTHRNYFKFIMSAVGYNLIKNSFGIYYLVIFPILLTLTNIVLVYNIVYLLGIMPVIMYVYTWGVLLIAIMFGGQLQEFIVKMVEDIKSKKWGLHDG